MRFCRRGRLFLYGIKRKSSQVDEYPINGCRHQLRWLSHMGLLYWLITVLCPLYRPILWTLQQIFVMHSAANFISGHCDLMGGVLVVIGERHDLLFLNIVLPFLPNVKFRLAGQRTFISFKMQKVQA